MSQYTDNFTRVPEEYPPDQVLSTYDPYLDGSYTPPLGGAVILYMVEPKLVDFFGTSTREGTVELDVSISIIQVVAGIPTARDEVTVGPINAKFDRPSFNGKTALAALSAEGVAPEEPFSLKISTPVINRTLALGELAVSVDIPTVESSTSVSGLTAPPVTLGTIEAGTTLTTIDSSYKVSTLEAAVALTD